MTTRFVELAGFISSVARRSNIEMPLTGNGTREDYTKLPPDIARKLVTVATTKEMMQSIAKNPDLHTQMISIRGITVLFGDNAEMSIAVAKNSADPYAFLRLLGPTLCGANDKARTSWVDRTGQPWPEDSKVCLQAGMSIVPLIVGFEDPDDEDSDRCFYTPAIDDDAVPVYKVTMKEMLIGTQAKGACFEASPVKGTHTLKGKMAFTGRLANITELANGTYTDKHSPTVLMLGLFDAIANDSVDAYLTNAKFGGTYSAQFTEIDFGVYPLVKTSAERRTSDGRNWINYMYTVVTPSGEKLFRVPPETHQIHGFTVGDLYPHTDENGVEHLPQEMFNEGLRGIAYIGNTTGVSKGGKTYTNPILSLVMMDDLVPVVAKPGQVFNVAVGGFVDDIPTTDIGFIVPSDEEDEEDGFNVTTPVAATITEKMKATAASAAPKAKVAAPVEVDDEDDDFGEDM